MVKNSKNAELACPPPLLEATLPYFSLNSKMCIVKRGHLFILVSLIVLQSPTWGYSVLCQLDSTCSIEQAGTLKCSLTLRPACLLLKPILDAEWPGGPAVPALNRFGPLISHKMRRDYFPSFKKKKSNA